MIELTRQLEMLPKLMNASQMRHQLLSQNIANLNTPGYERLDLNFEEQLSESLKTHPEKNPQIEPEIFTDKSSPAREDGNNVDVDKEIGQLNKNSMLYQMYSRLLRSQLDSMKRAIQGTNG